MAEPLSTAQLKAQVRKTTDDEDALIADYGVEAREWVEKYTGHILVLREVTDTFPEWGDYLTLRHQPITVGDPTPTLTVTYLDTDAAEIEYEGRVIRDQRYPWTIYPADGDVFPTLGTNGTITVVYTAGYATAGDVPNVFKAAIKLMVGAMMANRGSIPEETWASVRNVLRHVRGAVMA